MDNSYSSFIDSIHPLQAELIEYLDKTILGIEGTTRKIRFKVPFYDYNSWFCYLNPKDAQHIELCFLKGKLMKEQHHILEMKGRKMVSGLTLQVNEDIQHKIIVQLVETAISLNK